MQQAISKEEIAAVYPRVAQIIADALGLETADVKPAAPLIEELGAESIDFLDLVFRLERAFGVKIPRGKIVEDALIGIVYRDDAQIVEDAGRKEFGDAPGLRVVVIALEASA